MKLKNYLLIVLTVLCSIGSYAQSAYQIKGTVKGAGDGLPIPGVNVVIAGTTNGVATDFDGNYTIKAKSGDTLEFSSIGYTTKSIAVTGQKTINLVLSEDSESLDEVIVVGYGKRKKSHSTGSIASIGGNDVAAVQATRVDDALVGKLAGVRIQNQSGEPGAAPKIQVRAAASISGASGPLVVVDGYPISGGLNTINSNDIESLEVLKDAASSAIYGSRGANGVVLVTTKQGKTGKPSFSYNAYASVGSRYKKDNIQQTAAQWADHIETNIANGNWDVSEVDPALVQYRIDAHRDSPDQLAREDWLFKNGFSTSHDFSMRGGTEDVKYFASIGYQDTEGIALQQNYERINARMNLSANLSDKFTTGLTFTGFVARQDQLAHDQRDLLRALNVGPVYHTAASIAFVKELDVKAQTLGLAAFDNGYRGTGDGTFNSSIQTLEVGDTVQEWHYGRSGNGIGGSGDAGPATKLDNAQQFNRTYFANISSFLQFEVTDGLNIKTVLGGDFNDFHQYYYQGTEADSRERTVQSDLDQTDTKTTTILSETTVNYAKVIGKHDIAVVGGLEFQNTYRRRTSLRGTNVPFFGSVLNYALLAPEDITVTEIDEVIARNSIFGRINYAYDDRYLASVSLRRDGDSRFGENQRYATFPAVSLGWNVHNENFWEPISEAVSTFKLRFSSGSLGTTSFLSATGALSFFTPSATANGNGFLQPSQLNNPDLTWQTNTETNYGINLGFVNNRINFGVDYYTSNIEDILLNQSVSLVTGITGGQTPVNAGDVKSSGLEFELSASIIQDENFTWNASANLSTVSTEITNLGELDALPSVIYGQSGRGPLFRNYVGGEIGEMWLLETTGAVEDIHIADPTRNIGINSSESYVVDQNGDGVIDFTKGVDEGGDLIKAGTSAPDFYWGFNTDFKYKNFDFAMQWSGAQGGVVYNVDPIYFNSEFGGRLRASFDADNDGIADDSGKFYTQNRNQTESALQDASFAALRNLTLGYTLNDDITSKLHLSSFRLYIAATNLLYLTHSSYTGDNPEGIETTNGGYAGPTTDGVQVGASPIVRSITFGLNLNF